MNLHGPMLLVLVVVALATRRRAQARAPSPAAPAAPARPPAPAAPARPRAPHGRRAPDWWPKDWPTPPPPRAPVPFDPYGGPPWPATPYQFPIPEPALPSLPGLPSLPSSAMPGAVVKPAGSRLVPAMGRGLWPVPAATAPTAPRLRFGFKRSSTHTHQGLDIPAPEGSSVLTPWAGTIVHANDAYAPGFSGYGKAVVLRTDTAPPAYVLFAHLARTEVRTGDRVTAGARVGFVGRTKFTRSDPTAMFAASAPHLHLEVSTAPYPQHSEARTRLDPEQLLTLRHAA